MSVRRTLRSVLHLGLVAIIPVMLGAKGKCRRDVEPPPVEQTGVTPTEVPDVEVALQVASVAPTAVKPAIATDVTVFGAGFASGAQVSIGAFRVSNVQFVDANTLKLKAPGLPTGTHDLKVINPDGREATLRRALTAMEAPVTGTCARMAMYFDLDSASLNNSVTTALDAALPCLREQSRIRLEGHADERGTTDYNIALAQRRAESIATYLVSQGIPPSRLPVVSFGEERPADTSHSESAWAKNRRVDMLAQ